LQASFADLDGWRAIAFIVVSFPVTVVGAWVTAIATGMALSLLTYPLYWRLFDPTQTDEDGVVRDSAMQFGEFYIDTWPRALLVSAAGLAAMFVVPWLARFFATADGLLVRGLLGPTRISGRVEDLEATRARAVDDSAATLRRIERDLHDGAQARLVALAMQVDMAKERLAAGGTAVDDPDVARARELLDEAHRNATGAITELRDVTRSIHPPALDRGLDEALATLAARSGVPAHVDTRVSVRPSPAIETIAYYCVAELLTNVAKHSGASRAGVTVTDGDGVLTVRVHDDGHGGATVVPGGGLAGLDDRVRTVDGRLTLSSPPGGPTVATVDLPLGV
jgi:signal transduction histidine kinase